MKSRVSLVLATFAGLVCACAVWGACYSAPGGPGGCHHPAVTTLNVCCNDSACQGCWGQRCYSGKLWCTGLTNPNYNKACNYAIVDPPQSVTIWEWDGDCDATCQCVRVRDWQWVGEINWVVYESNCGG